MPSESDQVVFTQDVKQVPSMPTNVVEEAKVAPIKPKINVSNFNLGLKVEVPKFHQTN